MAIKPATPKGTRDFQQLKLQKETTLEAFCKAPLNTLAFSL